MRKTIRIWLFVLLDILIKIIRLPYDEIIGKTKEHEGKKYFIIDDYMLDKVLDKIRKIKSIEIFDNTKILIDKDDKLSDDITF